MENTRAGIKMPIIPIIRTAQSLKNRTESIKNETSTSFYLENMIKTETMGNTENMVEQLFESAVEYTKLSYDLVKLKTLDKASDFASSFISKLVVFVLIATFMLFLNFGLAFWLGELFGEIYLGFFVIAAFYVVAGIGFHLFLSKSVKKYICHSIIKKVLK